MSNPTIEEDDSDSISVTSSIRSAEQHEYVVKEILSERDEDGEPFYLVRWEGYSDERCTWEPMENFEKQTIKEWHEESVKHLFGDHPDTQNVIQVVDNYNKDKKLREDRRARKRKRLGFVAASIEGDEELHDIDDSDDSVDSVPLAQLSQLRNGALTSAGPSSAQSSSRSNLKRTDPKSLTTQPPRVTTATKKRNGPETTSALAKSGDSSRTSAIFDMKPALKKNKSSDTAAAEKPKSSGVSDTFDWLRTSSISKQGNLTAKRSTTIHTPRSLNAKSGTAGAMFDKGSKQYRYAKASRVEPIPDKEALNLKPAEEWTATPRVKTASNPSNVDALRSDIRPPSGQRSQTLPQQPNPHLGAETAADHETTSQSPVKRKAEELPIIPKRRRGSITASQSLEQQPRPEQHGRWNVTDMYLDKVDETRAKHSMNTFWHFGEALVHLYHDSYCIGPVRIHGLDVVVKAIIELKDPNLRELPLHLDKLVTRPQYNELCESQEYNTIKACGAATGFVSWKYPNTVAIRQFADYLTSIGKAAVWTTRGFTLLLYSSDSPEWADLHMKSQFRYPNEHLLVVARDILHYKDPLQARSGEVPLEEWRSLDPNMERRQPQASGKYFDHDTSVTAKSEPSTDPRIRPGRPSISTVAKSATKSEEDLEVQQEESPLRSDNVWATGTKPTTEVEDDVDVQPVDSRLRSQDRPEVPKLSSYTEALTPAKREEIMDEGTLLTDHPADEMTLGPSADIKELFKLQYGITFETLLGSRGKIDGDIHLIYLRFDTGQEKELESWKAFLIANGIISNFIYESTTDQAWPAWLNMFSQLPKPFGIIISHEIRSRDFRDMKSLADKVLNARKHVNLFRANISWPLNKSSPHIKQLFPSGSAILLTEASMLQDSARALAIIQWFSAQLKLKVPGTWKLMVRPNISSWLRKAVRETKDEKTGGRLIDMLLEIDRIMNSPSHFTRDHSTPTSPSNATRRLLEGLPPSVKEPFVSPLSPSGDYGDYIGNDNTEPDIISPDQMAGYGRPSKTHNVPQSDKDEDTMVTYFAGWSVSNTPSHRRFVAITPLTTKSWKHWVEWTHITIITAKSFCANVGISTSTAADPATADGAKQTAGNIATPKTPTEKPEAPKGKEEAPPLASDSTLTPPQAAE